MAELVTFKNDLGESDKRQRLGVVLSVLMHVVIFAVLFFGFSRIGSTQIVAAGPGEGGEGGGGSIEVGVGDTNDAINNARVENAPHVDPNSEALLPPTEKDARDPKSLKTDRPVVNREEKIFTGKEERGRSPDQTAQVGSTYGSPTPGKIGRLEIGFG